MELRERFQTSKEIVDLGVHSCSSLCAFGKKKGGKEKIVMRMKRRVERLSRVPDARRRKMMVSLCCAREVFGRVVEVPRKES
jgi:hypothetical protein